MRRWTQRQGECEQALGSKKHALVKKTPIQTTKLCQKERRRQWQKNKLQTDPDYRDNQARAQKAWPRCASDAHPILVEFRFH